MNSIGDTKIIGKCRLDDHCLFKSFVDKDFSASLDSEDVLECKEAWLRVNLAFLMAKLDSLPSPTTLPALLYPLLEPPVMLTSDVLRERERNAC